MNVPEVTEGEFAWVGGGNRAGRLAEMMGGIEENPFVTVNPEVCCVCLNSPSPQLLPVLRLEGGCTLPLRLTFFGYSFHLILCICSLLFWFCFLFLSWFLPLFVLDFQVLPQVNLQYVHFSYTHAGCFSQGSRWHWCSSGGKASSLAPSMIGSLQEYSP